MARLFLVLTFVLLFGFDGALSGHERQRRELRDRKEASGGKKCGKVIIIKRIL